MTAPSPLEVLASFTPGIGTLYYAKSLYALTQEESPLSKRIQKWRNSENFFPSHQKILNKLNNLPTSEKAKARLQSMNESRVYRLGFWGSLVRTTICAAAPLLFPGSNIALIALIGSVQFLSLEMLSTLYAAYKLYGERPLFGYIEIDSIQESAGKLIPLEAYQIKSIKRTWFWNPLAELPSHSETKRDFATNSLDQSQPITTSLKVQASVRQELRELKSLEQKNEEAQIPEQQNEALLEESITTNIEGQEKEIKTAEKGLEESSEKIAPFQRAEKIQPREIIELPVPLSTPAPATNVIANSPPRVLSDAPAHAKGFNTPPQQNNRLSAVPTSPLSPTLDEEIPKLVKRLDFWENDGLDSAESETLFEEDLPIRSNEKIFQKIARRNSF